jgi:hypothetical protein
MENKKIPYKKDNITNHNLLLFKQYYKHRQNRHYLDTIFKHFYQTQHKNTRFIPQTRNLPHIHIDPKKCNRDKDIQTNTPTIQTEGIITNLFDSEGIHIQTITTQKLTWLYNQYNKFKSKQIDIEPLLQNFETKVIALYQSYSMKTISQNQYHIDTIHQSLNS